MNTYIKNIMRRCVAAVFIIIGTAHAVSDEDRVNELSNKLTTITAGQITPRTVEPLIGETSFMYADISRDDLKENLRREFARFLEKLAAYYDEPLKTSAQSALNLAKTMNIDTPSTESLTAFVTDEAEPMSAYDTTQPITEEKLHELLEQQDVHQRELRTAEIKLNDMQKREAEIRRLPQETLSDEEIAQLIEERELRDIMQQSLLEKQRKLEQQLNSIQEKINTALSYQKAEEAPQSRYRTPIYPPQAQQYRPYEESFVGSGIIRPRQKEQQSTADEKQEEAIEESYVQVPSPSQKVMSRGESSHQAAQTEQVEQDEHIAQAQQFINEFTGLNFGVQTTNVTYSPAGSLKSATLDAQQSELSEQIDNVRQTMNRRSPFPNDKEIRAAFLSVLEMLAQHFHTLQEMVSHHEADTTRLLGMPVQAVRIAQELGIENDDVSMLKDGTYRYQE